MPKQEASEKTSKSRASIASLSAPGRLPPQNVEAEQSVLGALLIDKDAVIRVADELLPEDFYREDHAQIYGACLALLERRQPIDLVTLTAELEKKKLLSAVGGASYLAHLANFTPTAAHVAGYASIVKDKATLRRLIAAGGAVVALGYDEEGAIADLLDEAEKTLFNVGSRHHHEQFLPIKDILAASFERIDELHKEKGKLRGVRTGFQALDDLLAGLQASDLVILAARPSIGKTSLALSMAENIAVAEKIGVGVFSLEQSRDQLVDRMLAAVAGVDGWKLRTGNLNDDDFPKIGYAMGVLSEAPIYIDDSPLLNVMELRAKARRLQAEHELGLIIVDYLQLIQGRSRSADPNRVQEVSEISRSLKALARELNVPVLALSQLSRAVESRPHKIPQLSDLRDSGCLTGDTLIPRADTGELVSIAELARTKASIPIFAMDDELKIVRSTLTKAFPSGRKSVYELKLASGRAIKASSNHRFYSNDGWKRLDRLGINNHLATPRALASNSAIDWDEIIAIEPLGMENVYDATVTDQHNFVANDMIVHNSIEQDADVVMFLYREDYYDPDTERKNIVDVLIRKHRNGPTGQVELYFVKEQTRFRSIEKKRG